MKLINVFNLIPFASGTDNEPNLHILG